VRARGQGALAVAMVALALFVGLGFDRLGPAAPGPVSPGQAPSGAWFCPHGGGDGWQGTIYLANPGTQDVRARLTGLTTDGAQDPVTVTVPAGGEIAEQVAAGDRSSSTFVEYFGGWIAAGWLTRSGGVGAEPCAAQASTQWYAPDNTTQQGQEADLVIMNPFDADAVLSIVLFTAERGAPVRRSDLTDLTIKPYRSVSIPLAKKALGEEALTASVEASTGRVAVASLGIDDRGGVRSVLGWPGTSSQAYLPLGAGADQAQLEVTVPGDQGATFGGTLFSRDGPAPLPGLVGASQPPQTAAVYPVITAGPSAADLQTQGNTQIVAGLRSTGRSDDPGATSGVTAPATSWIVTPTVAGLPASPGIVLVNPGSDPVRVTLHLLTPASDAPVEDVTVTVPPASTVGAPGGFLESAPTASVLVTTDGGTVVALGASTSLGDKGIAGYALAAGLPVPSTP
jgi:Family of unknown function (DUF5719)